MDAELIELVKQHALTLEEMVDVVFQEGYLLESTEHRLPTQRDRFQWIRDAQVNKIVKALQNDVPRV